ncbi:MAG: RNA polymerase sigma-70 factor [Chitinophagaceae bacterium]|nr:RNA polymerase sigma-70 factor [Chitinophagaceae bacterium]
MKVLNNHTPLTPKHDAGTSNIEDAFHQLYNPLCYFAFQLINSKEAAEDIVTDFFTRIWQKPPALENSRVFRSYCYTAVRNACINHLKQQQRFSQKEEQWQQLQSLEQPAILDAIIQTETMRALNAAIETLPPRCRSVITSLYKEGKSIRETADEMQIAVETVKSLRQYGLKLLRKEMPLELWLALGLLAG